MVTKPAGFRQDVAMSPEVARELTDRIRAVLDIDVNGIAPMILAAFRGRAWNALGFTSWTSYCETEFAGPRMLRMPDDVLDGLIDTLAGEGLSSRAIAAATGRGKSTVDRRMNKDARPSNVVSINSVRRPASVERSMESHPSGKGKPQFATWEMVCFVVGDAGERGATYVDVCASLGWRDGKVTGALSEGFRRGRLTAAGSRDGNTVWIAVPE